MALATSESHDHCMLPHLEDQWSALFEQPYDGCRSKGIRLTDGIVRDNHTLAVLAAQMKSSAAISPDKANKLWSANDLRYVMGTPFVVEPVGMMFTKK